MRKLQTIAEKVWRTQGARVLGIASFIGASVFAINPAPAGTNISATVLESQITPTTYQYSITLSNSAANPSPVGTFWLAWVPGENFLDTSPLTVSNPAGWGNAITNNGPSDGFAIQWVSNASSASVMPGKLLSGFNFTSTDTPAQVFGNSKFYPSTPVLTSTTYSAGPFSDAGIQIVAAGAAGQTVPLPSAAWTGLVTLLGMCGFSMFRRRMFKLQS